MKTMPGCDDLLSMIRRSAALAASHILLILPVSAEPGDLDPEFGNYGISVESIGWADDQGNAVVIQNDGGILVAGGSVGTNGSDFGLIRFQSNGNHDTSFGSAGSVTTDFFGADDVGRAMALQGDGKVIVVGEITDGSNINVGVVRYTADGDLDPGFGTGGKVILGDADEDLARGIVIQGDGRIVIAGSSGGSSNHDIIVWRLNTNGSVDATFGSGGKTIITSPSDEVVNAMALQADGKIVVAGQSFNGSNYDFAAARFLSNGNLDTSFNNTGKVITQVTGFSSCAHAVAIQSNGGIILAGDAFTGSNLDVAAVRYLPNGTLDPSFGTGGKTTTTVGTADDRGRAVVVQSDGSILVAGDTLDGSSLDFALVRLLASGIVDTSFGEAGKVITPIRSRDDHATSMALQNDGCVIVAGCAINDYAYPYEGDIALVRYLTTDPNLTVEHPIGSQLADGTSSVDCGMIETNLARLRTLTLRNTGTADVQLGTITIDGVNPADFSRSALSQTLLAPGASTTLTVTFTPTSSGPRSAIIHINSNDADHNPFDIILTGTGLTPVQIVTKNPLPDATAGIPYVLQLSPSGSAPPYEWSRPAGYLPSGLSLSSSGTITGTPGWKGTSNFTARVTGNGGTSSAERVFDIAVLEAGQPGALDPAWSGDGLVVTSAGIGDDIAYAVATQNDGKTLVAGQTWNGTTNDIIVLRYLPDGTLDNTFGEGGKTITSIGGDDVAYGLALQSDGKIVVAGSTHNGTDYDFAVLRYLPDGNLDISFSADGIAVTSFGTGDARALDVAIQSDGKIVAAGHALVGTSSDMVVSRYLTNGTLDSTFGTNGRASVPSQLSNDYGTSVAISNNAIIIGGYTNINGSDSFALARLTITGQLDETFNGTGIVTTTLDGESARISGIVVQRSGVITVSGYTSFRRIKNPVLARYTSTGSLDPTFSGDGILIDSSWTSNAEFHDLALQLDGKIVVTGEIYNETGDILTARYLSNGTLDTTFAADGWVVTPVGRWRDRAHAVAIQPDGAVVVAGAASNGPADDIAVIRYLGANKPEILVESPVGANLTDDGSSIGFAWLLVGGPPAQCTVTIRNTGTADLTGLAITMDGNHPGDFIPSALETTVLTPGASTAFQVSFAPLAAGTRSAKLHIASNDSDENPFDIPLSGLGGLPPEITTTTPLPRGMVGAAYDLTFQAEGGTTPYTWSIASGSLPAGFTLSNAGVLTGTPVNATAATFTVQVTDGHLLSATKTVTLEFIPQLTRGALDPGFGNGGKVCIDFGMDETGQAVAVQPDGKIVVAGFARVGSNNDDFAIVRYQANGAPDVSFGNNGLVTTAVGAYGDLARAVAIQSDGKLVVTGDMWNGNATDFATVRYLTDGSLDTSFGTAGKVVTSIAGGNDYGRGIAIQADGKIITAGEAATNFAAVRYLSNGALDLSFNGTGKVSTDFGTNTFDYGYGMALQQDGKILVCGRSPGSDGSQDFALARYLTDGSLDPGFSGDGKLTTSSFSISQDRANAVAVQTDGRIVTVGEAGQPAFGVMRHLPNGDLDTSFSGDGKLVTDVGAYNDVARAVVIHPDTTIIVAGCSEGSGNTDFSMVRYLSNGNLDSGFGSGGKNMTSIGSDDDEAYAVALHGETGIILAGFTRNGTQRDFALVRYVDALKPEIAVEQPVGSSLTDNVSTVRFGTVSIGSPGVTQTFTVRNAGTAMLTGLALTLDGADHQDYQVTQPATTALAPGASITFMVKFTPNEPGNRVARIHLSSNDSDEAPFDLILSGDGGTPIELWRLTYFGSTADSGDGASQNDHDGDGYVNLLEYAFAGNPHNSDSNTMQPQSSHEGGGFGIAFRCNEGCTDLRYTVQFSADLGSATWTDIATSLGGGLVMPVGSLSEVIDPGIGVRTVHVKASSSLTPTGRGFLRVMISR